MTARITNLYPPGLNEHIFYVSNPYIQPDTAIVDISAGSGLNIKPFLDVCGDDQSFILYEPCMLHKDVKADSRVIVHKDAYRHAYDHYSVSLTLAIDALIMTPVAARQSIIDHIYARTLPGGALIFSECVIPPTAELASVFSNVSLSLNAGTCDEGIPVSSEWNVQMLRRAGFGIVECFYRSLNVAAWIAIRDC